jgi:hypothetical protein
MIFKPLKMFSLHVKMTLLVCFPVTRELRVEYKGSLLILQWLHYPETNWAITLNDREIADYLIDRLSQQEIYQRERFHSGASSHRWIWFYEAKIPFQVRSLDFNIGLVMRTKSMQFKPEDYGSEAMEIYIQQKLKHREAEYMTTVHLRTFVGTWNCAGDSPDESIRPWLKSSPVDPDIIIIGLQEVCELTPVNMLGDPERVREWAEFLRSEVRGAFGAEFIVVAQKDLVGLLLVLLVQVQHYSSVRGVETSAIKLGFRGYVGNKGAVVTRLDIYDTSICAINCHFEAHAGKDSSANVKHRNENFKQVVAKFKVNSELVSLHEHE